VAARSEKFAEVGGGVRKRARGGDADDIEALTPAVANDEGFCFGRTGDQKSRSA
jgi:hypothetical protein